MKQVILDNTRLDVVVAMMDELIRLHHAQGTHGDLHVPISNGISLLFDEIHRVFQKYNENEGCYKQNGKLDSRQELNVMRHSLLLRRIIEFSIGKRPKSESVTGKKFKFQVLWCKIEHRQYRHNGNHSHYSNHHQREK